MGVDRMSLRNGFEHWTIRGLRQAVLALQQFPLESVIQDDPYDIAPVIRAVLDAAVAHVAGTLGADASAAPAFSEEQADLAELTRVDPRCVQGCVARCLFGHLHGRLFPSKPTEEDLKTSDRISRLQWLRPHHLDVPEYLVETPQARHVARLLRGLHAQPSPADMFRALGEAFCCATESASVRARYLAATDRAGASVCGSSAFGADDSLPLFILIMLRANPPMLNSVLAYAECFTSRQQMLTEQGYALTQARAALAFTQSLRREHLLAVQPGEWERHMAQEGGVGGGADVTAAQ